MSPQDFQSELAGKVRVVLMRLEPGASATTKTLVEMLKPGTRRLEEVVYKALLQLAKGELADCARRGDTEVVRVRGTGGRWLSKKRRPWLWALYGEPNDEAPRCPHCGGVL